MFNFCQNITYLYLKGNIEFEKILPDLIYYDVENYCVAITSQEVPKSNPSGIMKRSVTKISETSDGFQKLDLTSVPLLSSGTGMKYITL